MSVNSNSIPGATMPPPPSSSEGNSWDADAAAAKEEVRIAAKVNREKLYMREMVRQLNRGRHFPPREVKIWRGPLNKQGGWKCAQQLSEVGEKVKLYNSRTVVNDAVIVQMHNKSTYDVVPLAFIRMEPPPTCNAKTFSWQKGGMIAKRLTGNCFGSVLVRWDQDGKEEWVYWKCVDGLPEERNQRQRKPPIYFSLDDTIGKPASTTEGGEGSEVTDRGFARLMQMFRHARNGLRHAKSVNAILSVEEVVWGAVSKLERGDDDCYGTPLEKGDQNEEWDGWTDEDNEEIKWKEKPRPSVPFDCTSPPTGDKILELADFSLPSLGAEKSKILELADFSLTYNFIRGRRQGSVPCLNAALGIKDTGHAPEYLNIICGAVSGSLSDVRAGKSKKKPRLMCQHRGKDGGCTKYAHTSDGRYCVVHSKKERKYCVTEGCNNIRKRKGGLCARCYGKKESVKEKCWKCHLFWPRQAGGLCSKCAEYRKDERKCVKCGKNRPKHKGAICATCFRHQNFVGSGAALRCKRKWEEP